MRTFILIAIVMLTIGGCDEPAEGCDRVAVASSFGVSSLGVSNFPIIQTVIPPIVQTVAVAQPVITSFAVAQPVFQTVGVSTPICDSRVCGLDINNVRIFSNVRGCNVGIRTFSLFGGRSVSRSRAVNVNRVGLRGRGVNRSRAVSISRGF